MILLIVMATENSESVSEVNSTWVRDVILTYKYRFPYFLTSEGRGVILVDPRVVGWFLRDDRNHANVQLLPE